MIVYRELSSLCRDLEVSSRTLYGVSRQLSKHYRTVSIPKSGGEERQLHVPDDLLKMIQTRIYERLLSAEPISPYASAYRPGGSTKRNARAHVGKELVLKLDIRRFFDSSIYPLVKDRAFPEERYSEPNRILLSILCTFHGCLPQGAPTSPSISNLIMRDFDEAVGSRCRERGIAYTRYCDDMTFSGSFDPAGMISFVSSELRRSGYFLNGGKTATARRGRRQQVTGIVVNEKLSVPAEYKRELRQTLYYCKKYGIASHLERTGSSMSADCFRRVLLGRLNYVLSVEPDNAEAEENKLWLIKNAQ